MAKVGLVTVLYNSNEVLEGFFKSLSAQTFRDYKLYIIDNSPSAETDKVISQYTTSYPILEYIHIKSCNNIGVAAGNNVGIKAALEDASEYVLLLNNDIEFEQSDLIEELVNQAELRKESLVIPKILFYDSRKIWMAGGYLNKFRATSIHVGENRIDSEEFNQPKYFGYAPTCFMLIKASIFQEIGLMDEKYFVYYDDTDFIYRATLKKHKIYYMPQYKILHKVSSSTGGSESSFSIYYGNRNRVYFIKKHFGLFHRLVSYSYFLTSRIIKYFQYNKVKKEKLFQAIKDGFKMTPY